MRLTVGLVCLVASTSPQTVGRDARILRWLIAVERSAAPHHRLQVALLADSSADASALTRRLRALGLPLVAPTARPGRDTALLRLTLPVHDSLDYYRIGVERLSCRDGRLQGGRTVIQLRCRGDSCDDFSETPLGDGGVDRGPCGRPG